MKSLNIFVSSLLSASLFFGSSFTNVFAEEKPECEDSSATKTTLHFRDYSFTTSDIDPDALIVYSNDDYSEKYEIISPETGLVLEEYVVEYPAGFYNNTRGTTYTYFYKYQNVYDGMYCVCTLTYSIYTLYYSSGSFRQFESLLNHHLSAQSNFSIFTLQNVSENAWSQTFSFPCTAIDYQYYADLVASASLTAPQIATLQGAGFTIGITGYYTLHVTSSGTFNLY